MVFHFLILSGEDEDFIREILIDGKSSFLDFHKAIQEGVGYDQGQLASFFLSDADWEKGKEITLMQMDEQSESLLMEEQTLNTYINEPKDRLIYTFDFFGNRGFFVELLNVSEERTLKKPALVRAKGDAPNQILMDEFGGETDVFDFEEEDEFSNEDFEELGFDILDDEW